MPLRTQLVGSLRSLLNREIVDVSSKSSGDSLCAVTSPSFHALRPQCRMEDG